MFSQPINEHYPVLGDGIRGPDVDNDVHFLIWTKENPTEAYEIVYNDLFSISNSPFKVSMKNTSILTCVNMLTLLGNSPHEDPCSWLDGQRKGWLDQTYPRRVPQDRWGKMIVPVSG